MQLSLLNNMLYMKLDLLRHPTAGMAVPKSGPIPYGTGRDRPDGGKFYIEFANLGIGARSVPKIPVKVYNGPFG